MSASSIFGLRPVWKRHPDDAILFELDYSDEQDHSGPRPIRFTERAKRAQKAKWQRLYHIYRPGKGHLRLFRHKFDPDTPLVALGWAYKMDFLKAYAEKNHVEFELPPRCTEATGSRSIRYGAMTTEQLQNEQLVKFVNDPLMVRVAVHCHLEKELGIQLDNLRPFTDRYDRMWVLYTNHDDGEERYNAIQRNPGGMKAVIQFMNHAMNQCGHQTSLLWWYESDHLRVGLGTPL